MWILIVGLVLAQANSFLPKNRQSCPSQGQIVDEYRRLAEMPAAMMMKRELEKFFEEVERCRTLRSTLTAAIKAENYDELRLGLIDRWANANNEHIENLHFASTTAGNRSLDSFNLSPEERQSIESRRQESTRDQLSALSQLHNAPQGSCSSVDLTPKLPALKKQGQTGLCASFTVADMISLETGKNVSPMSLAVGLGDYDRGRQLGTRVGERPDDVTLANLANRGAILWEPLLTAQRNGYCLESQLPSNRDQVFHTDDSSEQLNRLRQTAQGASPVEGVEVCNQATSNLQQLFPQMSPVEIAQLAESAGGKLYQEMFHRCKQKLPPEVLSKYQMTELRRSKDQNIKRQLLDSTLDQGAMVGTVIPFSIYEDPKNAGREVRHAVGVVGRRRNPQTGHCEYLLRDSMGSPSKIHPSYTRHSEGHTWIPESALLESMTQVLSRK